MDLATQAPVPDAQAVAELKRQWLDDPIWDIESTEGFEVHHEDLLAFRQQCEAKWEQERADQLSAKAIELGVPGNITLANYVLSLERRLERIEMATLAPA